VALQAITTDFIS